MASHKTRYNGIVGFDKISYCCQKKEDFTMSLKANLAVQLKRYRKLQNRSIVEFAADLGIAKSTLQDFEAEKGNPTLDTIDLMERNLGVEDGTLLLSARPSASAANEDARLLLSAIPALKRLSSERRSSACELLIQLTELLDGKENGGV